MNNYIENGITENEDIFNDDIYVDSTVTMAYPGQPLSVGSSGTDVSVMQSYLNAIRTGMFPSLSRLSVDGIYGPSTRNTVMRYQGLSGLSIDGHISEQTWNAIIEDYNSLPDINTDKYPGTVLRPGSSGIEVRNMQVKLNRVSPVYNAINYQTVDGIYGNNMKNAVRRFQLQFGLNADGLIGPLTWDKINSVHTGVTGNNNTNVSTAYPGTAQRTGSQGDHVRFIQSYMNSINRYNSYNWPVLTVDGIYGRKTKQVVMAFQIKYGLSADGIAGPATWRRMITEFNSVI